VDDEHGIRLPATAETGITLRCYCLSGPGNSAFKRAYFQRWCWTEVMPMYQGRKVNLGSRQMLKGQLCGSGTGCNRRIYKEISMVSHDFLL